MSVEAIQDQLAERMAAIGRKHHGSRLSLASAESWIAAGNEQSKISLSRPSTNHAHSGLLPTGLHDIDEALGGGLRAGVHEWYGLKNEPRSHEGESNQDGNPNKLYREETRRKEWATSQNRQSTIDNRQFVPLCLLVHLAWQGLEANPSRWVIWVGKNCFPYPAVLVRDAGRDLRLLRRSLFVQTDAAADRVWASDLSVRSGLAGAVIADGTGLDMATTRRLQLSARSQGTFVFLARPPQDLDKLSAATTRWRVVPGGMVKRSAAMPASAFGGLGHPTHENPNPQWTLELLRCKGMQPSTSRRVWLVEWNRAANVIGVHTPLCDSLADPAKRAANFSSRGL